MKIIVGLGNIGAQFDNTRHNIGFIVINYILKKLKLNEEKEKLNGLITKTKVNEEEFVFVKPTTLMNLSGDCVSSILNFYHATINDLIVFCDDLDQNLGKFKIKINGSSGGHNGIKDIITKIGTQNFVRFKIGIGRPTKKEDVKNYVLSKFKNDELNLLHPILEKAYKFIQLVSNNSINIALSKLNN